MLLLAACSSGGEDEPVVPEKEQSFILFGSGRQSGVEWANGRVQSRADEKIDSETPMDMGVFAFGDGKNTTYIFNNRRVYYKDSPDFLSRAISRADSSTDPSTGNPTGNPTDPNNPTTGNNVINGIFTWKYVGTSNWPYTEDPDEKSSVQRPWEKMNYKFFAYSPWYPTKKDSKVQVSVTAENYSGFNSFTWDNIPGFSDKDFVLANEIVPVENPDGTRTTPQVVKFTMRHILSRIRFFFRMDEHYRTIRKIELNSLTVLTAGKVKTATFNFNSDASWDGTVHWSNEQTGDADPVTLVNKETAHYFIPTTYPEDPFASVYVYPQENFSSLKMRVDYTVYDSANVATRHTTAVNTINITPAWTLESGYYYDIKISIVPAYLYVLSDNDQDFDGYVIIKDS